MREILKYYGFDENNCRILSFGNGLINNTWLVEINQDRYILQRINQAIFKTPEDIAFNIRLVSAYLKEHYPDYLFVSPLQTMEGADLVKNEGGYFRIFPFVKDSHVLDTVQLPAQAYEAAKQFGKFTRLLSGLDASLLKITLPDFHNLDLRYRQFEEALQMGNTERIKHSEKLISFLHAQKAIVDEFDNRRADFKIRCTHHDTKISNVLFDGNDKGLCVIDLDTLMPGYFISDVGDMLRTYLSPVSEEEKDFSKIEIRKDFYQAIVNGYMSEMGEELNETEKKHFLFAGKFMIYMQAIRFLTDYINNDVYYGSKYEGQNFVRAGNQIALLQRLIEFEEKVSS